jgi:small GTP-binding protein
VFLITGGFVAEMKDGKLKRFTPTQRPVQETMEIGNVHIKAWDMGGHKAVRDIWEDYYVEANAIIYMVDLSDDARLEEAREGLASILAQSSKVPFGNVVLLVLGNKCDKPKLVDLGELEKFLNLDEARRIVKSVGIFRCSLYTGTGLAEALKWLEGELR